MALMKSCDHQQSNELMPLIWVIGPRSQRSEVTEDRGQVWEGLGWYFTLLKSSTVVSTGGVFQYFSRPNARHRAMAAICNTHPHTHTHTLFTYYTL